MMNRAERKARRQARRKAREERSRESFNKAFGSAFRQFEWELQNDTSVRQHLDNDTIYNSSRKHYDRDDDSSYQP